MNFNENITAKLGHRISNALAPLLAINAVNLAFSISYIPIIIYYCGLHDYGILATTQYFTIAFYIILEYGYTQYLLTELARNEDSKKKSQLILSALACKLLILFIMATVVGSIISLSLTGNIDIGASALLLAPALITSAANSFYPNWLYQTNNQSFRMIAPTVISKILALSAITAAAKLTQSITLIAWCISMGSVIQLIHSLPYIRRHIDEETRLDRSYLISISKKSLSIFISRMSSAANSLLAPLTLALIAPPSSLAIYSLCDKVLTLVRTPFDLFGTSIQPMMARNYCPRIMRTYLVISATTASTIFTIIATLLVLSAQQNELHTEINPIFIIIYATSIIAISLHSILGSGVLMANSMYNSLAASIIAGIFVFGMSTYIQISFRAPPLQSYLIGLTLAEFSTLTIRLATARKHGFI